MILFAPNASGYQPPTITSVSTGLATPNLININTTATISVVGTNFIAGETTVTVRGVSASSVSVSSPTALTFAMPLFATQAWNTVVVTTPGGSATQTSAIYSGLTPVITSTSPASPIPKTTTSITLYGQNFTTAGTYNPLGSVTYPQVQLGQGINNGGVRVPDSATNTAIFISGFTLMTGTTVADFLVYNSAGTGGGSDGSWLRLSVSP